MAKVNLTYTTGMVLHAIAAGYRYGFDIMDASGLPDGTVYPALRRLESAGYLSSEWEEEAAAEKRPRRRYYALTQEGEALLREAKDRFVGLQWSLGPEGVLGTKTV